MNPEEKEQTSLKQIRTFQGDVAEALQNQDESLVSIQQAEHLRRSSAESNVPISSENSKKIKEMFFLSLGGIILVALGAVGIWFAYNEFVRKTTAPAATAPINRFISPDSEIDFNTAATSRDVFIKNISAAKENTAPGELKHIVFKKEKVEEEFSLMPVSEFLSILETHAPGSLIRSFSPLFMYGTYGESAFLIIKLASFENAFAGMLAWEKDLATDIGPLFATARFLREILPGTVFTDVTDRNKDIRLLALEEQTILLYSFFDNNMLIITDSIETLRTLIERLTREKLSR